MKKIVVIFPILVLTAALLISCGDTSTGANGPVSPDTTKVPLDTTVVGKWEGAIQKISFLNFNGTQIFLHISGVDSSFNLISRDSSKGVALPIKDTTLILAGTWRLNPPKDSILLICDTCRIIDTTTNTLVPRPVKGQIIPMPVAISKDKTSGEIQWNIAMADIIPLAPLLGIHLPPNIDKSLLQAFRIILVKRSQTDRPLKTVSNPQRREPSGRERAGGFLVLCVQDILDGERNENAIRKRGPA